MKIISIVNYFGVATNSNGALRIPLAAHISAVQLGPKVASSLKLIRRRQHSYNLRTSHSYNRSETEER